MQKKLLLLELKTYLRQLPVVLLMSAALIFILGTACFGISRLLYRNDSLVHATVAIVTDEQEDFYLDMVLQVMSDNKTVEKLLTFTFMEEAAAQDALKGGRVIAVMYFPPHAVADILNGTNTPIHVIFSGRQDITGVLLAEVTNTLGSYLASAQAGIYAVAELYSGEDSVGVSGDAFNHVNMVNLSYVLDHDGIFKTEPVMFGATGSVAVYYFASAVLMFSLFVGSSYSGLLAGNKPGFLLQLGTRRISASHYLFLKYTAYSVFTYLCSMVLYLGSCALTRSLNPSHAFLPVFGFNAPAALFLFVYSLFLAAYGILLSNLSSSPAVTVPFFFLIGGGFLYCSGSILPAAFLPQGLRTLSGLLPTSYFQMVFTILFSGKELTPGDLFSLQGGLGSNIFYPLLVSLLFYGITNMIIVRRNKC